MQMLFVVAVNIFKILAFVSPRVNSAKHSMIYRGMPKLAWRLIRLAGGRLS
jgi:hypothetical protein